MKGTKSETETTYNGWSNYETWAVALWLDNEESTYRYWRETAQRHRDMAYASEQVKGGIWTQKEAAIFQLAGQLKDDVCNQNPLADALSMYSDLLSSALSQVDWQEIAASWLDEFEEPVLLHAYTRQQAVADGNLVDVTTTAMQAGIKYPTALTRAVWNQYVEVPDGVDGQDEDGRLWDVLWMFRMAPKSEASELLFQLRVRNDNDKPGLVELKAVCGPGDDVAPVITIMLPDED